MPLESHARRAGLAGALILLAASALAAAEAVEEAAAIPMPDGVVLEATVARPAGEGTYSTILVRTPYGRGQHLEEARFWSRHGYAVVVQDVRGKFGSGAEFVPFLNEYADGKTTLDWIVAQAWSNGRVGMWGSSYLAFSQLVLASKGHPALRSIMPISGWIHDEGQITHGGANQIMLSIPWILHEETQTSRSTADYDLEEMFEHLPLMEVFSSVGIDSKIWNEEFDFTHLEAYTAKNIRIPALHVTGWHDFVHDAALGVYAKAKGGPAGSLQKLMVGPWIHDQFYTTFTEVGDVDFGPRSAMGRERLRQLTLDWFDATLGSAVDGLPTWPDVKLFVMGADEWRTYDAWPPTQVKHRKFFLGSREGANSSRGDGTLTAVAAKVENHDHYTFDPNDPVPTYGGANMHFFLHLVGVKDQREIEKRDDVLVYTSAPLEEDLEVAGPVSVVLYASTQGRDTDFTAKLVEVRPDGYARIVEDGIVRASLRAGTGERELLEPGKVYRLTIRLGATSILIRKRHQVRLEVSSSNFPKYDRNPNTGVDPLHARSLLAVEQTIHHGGEYPSHLVLPVVERRRPGQEKEELQ